jgi:hypothetical protein
MPASQGKVPQFGQETSLAIGEHRGESQGLGGDARMVTLSEEWPALNENRENSANPQVDGTDPAVNEG